MAKWVESYTNHTNVAKKLKGKWLTH